MASALDKLETKLDALLVRNAPALPDGGKKFIVNWAPLASLVLGALSLLGAWSMWHWASVVDNGLKGICNAYSVSGCGSYVTSRYTFWLWLGLAVLAVEGVLYLMAYSGLRDRKKAGWNYLFYGALLSLGYVVVSFFADYVAGGMLGSLVGSVIGFYLLFQVRSAYTGDKRASTSKPDSKK